MRPDRAYCNHASEVLEVMTGLSCVTQTTIWKIDWGQRQKQEASQKAVEKDYDNCSNSSDKWWDFGHILEIRERDLLMVKKESRRQIWHLDGWTCHF